MRIWHYADSSKQQQQASEDQLPSLISHGIITPQTPVWTSGQANWQPAQEVLGQFFNREGASGPPPIPGAPSSAKASMRSHEVDYELFGDDMQVVEVELDPGETVIGEAGAMNYLEEEIQFESKMGDGTEPDEGLMGKLLSAGKRMITGESIFMTHFTHEGHAGKRRVAFAAPYPGKIIPVDLSTCGGELICQKDSFLCAALGTEVSITFNKRFGAGLFGGEGFILQKLVGDGMAFVHAGGTVIKRELKGETLRVDTGCLVAFSPGIQYDIQRAGNLKSMFFGGEGLFLATLQGHGTVYLQSLPFSRMADRILKHAPGRVGGSSQGEGSVLGGLGRILDGD